MSVSTKLFLVALLGGAALFPGCSREAAPREAPADAQGWSEARVLPVAEAALASGERLWLELRHEPAGEGGARMRLVLVGPGREEELWSGAVDLAGRDRLWGAQWALGLEGPPGGRLAVSTDAGARWRLGLPGADGWLFCPHLQVEGRAGAPDWEKLPGAGRWAAQVLQTAVWGCDGAGAGCRSRALSGGPAHHSHGGEELLAKERLGELRAALGLSGRLEPDRGLALALFDAAVGYQHGLEREELERLGALAARGLAAEGPLGQDERRTLGLRLTLAREELKSSPPGQLSPRVSIEALARGLAAAPPR